MIDWQAWRYWDFTDWLLWLTLGAGTLLVGLMLVALVHDANQWADYVAANGCRRTGEMRQGSTYLIPVTVTNITTFIPQTHTLEEWRCTTAEETIWR